MKDKYILLDFWASWDKASMAAQRFTGQRTEGIEKEKFLIVSLSLDLDKKRMVEGLRQRHHPVETSMWLKGWDNSIVKQQGITRLPPTSLIATQ